MTKIRIENANDDLIKELDITPGKVLLSQLEAAGVEIPNACRAGMCAACMCHVKSGQEYINKSVRGEPAFPLGEDEIMTCIGGVEDTSETIILKTIY